MDKNKKELLSKFIGSSPSKVDLNKVREEWKYEDDLIQYFVVNKDLTMSTGKVAAQVAHVATLVTNELYDNSLFQEWLDNGQTKVILKGREKDLIKLIENKEIKTFHIRDSGKTEIPPDSLTVVGFPPLPKNDVYPYVKRLRLY